MEAHDYALSTKMLDYWTSFMKYGNPNGEGEEEWPAYTKEHPYMNDIIEEYQELNSSIEDAYIANTSYLPQLESPEKFVELIQILIG